MTEFLLIIGQHGPWAALSFYLVYRLQTENKLNRDVLKDVTKSIATLSTLLDERTRAP